MIRLRFRSSKPLLIFMTITISTWNVSRRNRNLLQDLKCIESEDPDVICLQEFPADKVSLLAELTDFTFVQADEKFIGKKPKRSTLLKLIILSKMPISGHKVIRHEQIPFKPWRYINFKDLDISFLYVDIEHPKMGPIRLFNVHFECVTSPSVRSARFLQVTANFSRYKTNIICGDFNNFGKPWINLFVWWFYRNYSFKEIFRDEKKIFQQHFADQNLHNHFNNTKTFRKIPFQLDYILTPPSIKALERKVLGFNHGSDHNPILLKITSVKNENNLNKNYPLMHK